VHEISETSTRSELAFVLHFHQPVGNFGEVFEKVTEVCYAPLLELLFEYPELKFHFHFNAILLEWFDKHRPDLLRILQRMVRRGSVELLTGGLNEPILGILPEDDAIGQVRALSLELEQRFAHLPQGAWLTERVWEPRLPNPLARAGVRYVVLDDIIFSWAGIEANAMSGHYVTDDAGFSLNLFPGSKALRYTIPFRPPEETLELLHGLPRDQTDPPLMVYADDAEKFGEWPGTYEWVYTKGWLKNFLEKLRDDPAISLVHLKDRLAQHLPLGRVYPPAASYPELTVWAMPTRARTRMEGLLHQLEKDDPAGLLPLLRGGHWRGFLGKYPEANRLHKRMLRVSRKLRDARAKGLSDARMGEALRDLYRGQCNDAYWHGVFGGLYLPHLRRALQSSLIRAERTLDRLEKEDSGWSTARLVDFDADGIEEAELANPHTHLVLDPKGGRLLSWDLRAAGDNWVAVMQRHEEPFHAALREGNVIHVDAAGNQLDLDENADGIPTIHGAVRVKPGVKESDLAVDLHSRVAAISWSAPQDESIADPRALHECAVPLQGRWEIEELKQNDTVTMRTEQHGLRVGQTLKLHPRDAALGLKLELEALEGPCKFLSEWNLFVGWTGDDLELASEEAMREGARDDGSSEGWESAASGEKEQCERLLVRGGGERKLELKFAPAACVRWAPVHTVSSSESGLEKIGQGTCFLFEWRVEDRLQVEVQLIPSARALADESLDG